MDEVGQIQTIQAAPPIVSHVVLAGQAAVRVGADAAVVVLLAAAADPGLRAVADARNVAVGAAVLALALNFAVGATAKLLARLARPAGLAGAGEAGGKARGEEG